jgi:hypothetical protein
VFIGFQLPQRNPLFESPEIQQVLQIKSVLGIKNYARYFEMLEGKEYPYLLSCLMVLNVEKIRGDISAQCEKIFKYKEDVGTKKGVEVGEMKKMLNFG